MWNSYHTGSYITIYPSRMKVICTSGSSPRIVLTFLVLISNLASYGLELLLDILKKIGIQLHTLLIL